MTLIIVALLIAVVVSWNVYPPFREKLRGWSTIIEGLLGTAFHYFGFFASALDEAKNMGYVPEDLERYTPFILFVWVMVKRFQTKTKIGDSNENS